MCSVQPLDQCLLPFDASKGQQPVAGSCRQPNPLVHEQTVKDDMGLAALVPIVPVMTPSIELARRFFDRYEAGLLARDEKAISGMYAVPSLILFPGNSIAVTDARQTEEFFASSWSQYDEVDEVDKQITIMGEAAGSIWADVTWSYQGRARERFCYQLFQGPDGYQIAVLTPMALDG